MSIKEIGVTGIAADTINEAAEAVQNISVLKSAILELVLAPGGWAWFVIALILASFFWLVRHNSLSDLVEVFGFKERKRLQQLEAYIENSEIADPIALDALKTIRDAFYFKIATGLYAEKAYRDNLIELHERTSSSVTWKTIRLAKSYIEPDCKSVKKIGFLGVIERIFYIISGFLMLIIAALLFIAFWLSDGINGGQFIVWFGVTAIALALAYYAFSQNLPFVAVNVLRKELEEEVEEVDEVDS